jgi:hypothetical protein
MTADLLVICVTRGRPHSVPDLWDAWTATSDGRADLLFAVDDDDPALGEYQALSGYLARHSGPRGPLWGARPRLRLAGTLNAVALKYAGTYRMLGSWGDDHRPRTPHWDTRMVEAIDGMGGTGVAYGDDLLQGERIPTAVAMSSDIVTALGYMAIPGPAHLCIDMAWLDWGKAIGKVAYLPDVVIEHCHPAAGTAPMDAGYEDVNSPERTAADQAAYLAYRDEGGLARDAAKLRALVAGGLPA